MRLSEARVSLDELLDGVLGEFRAMLTDVLERGMGPGGYDRDAAEASAFALSTVLEARAPGACLGSPAYDPVVRGMVVGLGVALGGQRAYARYLRRHGAIGALLRDDLPGVAMGLLSEREVLDGAVMAAPTGTVAVVRSGPTVDVAPPLAPVAGRGRPDEVRPSVGVTLVEVAPIRLAVHDGHRVRRFVEGDELLFSGIDAFTALHYANPASSLSHFVARPGSAELVRRATFPDGRGRRREAILLTVAGIVLAASSMGNRAPGREDGKDFVAALLARILPSGILAPDARLAVAAAEVTRVAEAHRRHARLLAGRLSRQEATTRELAAEVTRLQDSADLVEVVAHLRGEVAKMATRTRGLETALSEREAALRRAAFDRESAAAELAAERGERLAAEAELGALRATARHWEGVAKDLLRSGARVDPLLAPRKPDDPVN